MTQLKERGGRASAELHAALVGVPIPDFRQVVVRARRVRYTMVGVCVIAVLLGAVVGIAAQSSSETPRITVGNEPAREVPHFDVVPTFFWVDARDRYAAADVRGVLESRLEESGQSMSRMECSPGQLPGYLEPTQGFEDPAFYRDPGAVKTGHPQAEVFPSGTPPPACSPEIATAAAHSDARWEPLRTAWNERIAALEADGPIAAARATAIDCLTAKGYPLTPDGSISISNGYFQRNPSLEVLRQADLDRADCIEPVVAARAQLRPAARDAFVAGHSGEIREFQHAFDTYVASVFAAPTTTGQGFDAATSTTLLGAPQCDANAPAEQQVLPCDEGDRNLRLSERTVVAEGNVDAGHWQLEVYQSTAGLCADLRIGAGAGGGCGGDPNRPIASAGTSTGLGIGRWTHGQLREDVAHVRIELADGLTIEIDPIVDRAGFPINFFVAQLPDGTVPIVVVAFNAEGREIDRLHMPAFEER